MEICMDKFKSMHEFLKTLSPQEVRALRKRFGIDSLVNDVDDGTDFPPPDDDDDNGSGGVPAAADYFTCSSRTSAASR